MCEALEEALQRANSNLNALSLQISALKVPCNYKAAFMKMADHRGFRFTDDTLSQMEVVGQTKSEVLIHLLDGKAAGLVVPYTLATQLSTDKQRAKVLQLLRANGERVTELNTLRAILTVKSDD